MPSLMASRCFPDASTQRDGSNRHLGAILNFCGRKAVAKDLKLTVDDGEAQIEWGDKYPFAPSGRMAGGHPVLCLPASGITRNQLNRVIRKTTKTREPPS